MDITTNDDWTWVGGDFRVAYATTSDPRVVAVIERDDDTSIGSVFDGDAIPGIYGIEYIGEYRTNPLGGYGGDKKLAQHIVDARSRFQYAAGYRYNGLSGEMVTKSLAMLRRWAWIFHGTAFEIFHENGEEFLVLNSLEFREHIGWGDCTQEDAQESANGTSLEVSKALYGDVFGVGWATNVGRVMDDEAPIDPTDAAWTMNMECWGHVGEEYAQEVAARFDYGTPDLEPMLDFDEPGFIEHTDRMANIAAEDAR